LLCAVVVSCAREPGALTPEAVRKHVEILAADSLQGRGAGYAGERTAATYVASQFRSAGLQTSVQSFAFLPRQPEPRAPHLQSQNVIAVLPGIDERLAREFVLVGAHLDGQGMTGQADAGRLPADSAASQRDTIWNSADDNASSVAALLEIARQLAARKLTLRRAVVFAAFGAEEHALNGSAFLALHPAVPGARPIAMVNVEKIGRVPDHPLIAAGCSTSHDWAALLRTADSLAGQTVECILPELLTDTDHYPFGAVGIPALVLGIAHEEDTHQPTDEVGRINFAALAKRARYIEQLLIDLADADQPPAFDSSVWRGSGAIVMVASPAERSTLGLGNHGALKVGTVLPGLPAAEAGLKEGDFVVAVKSAPLDSVPNDRLMEKAFAAAGPVAFSVRRGAEALNLTALGKRSDSAP